MFNHQNSANYIRYMLEGGNATGFKILYYLSNTYKKNTNWSVRALAKEIDCSSSSVHREMKKLIKLGFIKELKKDIELVP
jgi:DNA-binding MarR family transcriptional regulator